MVCWIYTVYDLYSCLTDQRKLSESLPTAFPGPGGGSLLHLEDLSFPGDSEPQTVEPVAGPPSLSEHEA